MGCYYMRCITFYWRFKISRWISTWLCSVPSLTDVFIFKGLLTTYNFEEACHQSIFCVSKKYFLNTNFRHYLTFFLRALWFEDLQGNKASMWLLSSGLWHHAVWWLTNKRGNSCLLYRGQRHAIIWHSWDRASSIYF